MPLLDKYPGIVYRCENGSLKEVTNDFNRMCNADEADAFSTTNEAEQNQAEDNKSVTEIN